jgi:predicted nucleotidyltransferase
MTSAALDTNKLIEICRRNDVSMLGVFGSVARGEATAQSDVDLLVKFSKGKSLLAVVSLERQLSEALGRKVDLLTEGDLSPYLRSRILRDVRVIYEGVDLEKVWLTTKEDLPGLKAAVIELLQSVLAGPID